MGSKGETNREKSKGVKLVEGCLGVIKMVSRLKLRKTFVKI